jgi:hypothetical protein
VRSFSVQRRPFSSRCGRGCSCTGQAYSGPVVRMSKCSLCLSRPNSNVHTDAVRVQWAFPTGPIRQKSCRLPSVARASVSLICRVGCPQCLSGCLAVPGWSVLHSRELVAYLRVAGRLFRRGLALFSLPGAAFGGLLLLRCLPRADWREGGEFAERPCQSWACAEFWVSVCCCRGARAAEHLRPRNALSRLNWDRPRGYACDTISETGTCTGFFCQPFQRHVVTATPAAYVASTEYEAVLRTSDTLRMYGILHVLPPTYSPARL